MLSFMLFFFLVAAIVHRYFQKKASFALYIVYLLIPTYLSLGGLKIDSWYLSIPIFLFAVIYKDKGKLYVYNQEYIRHMKMLAVLYFIYLFAWLLFSRRIDGQLIGTLAAVVKISMILGLGVILNRNISSHQIRKQMYTMLLVINSLNMILCLLQKANTSIGLELIKLLNDEQPYQFALTVTKYGSFSRCFGIMPYPMHMAIFCLFSITYVAFDTTASKPKIWIPIVFFGFICGMLSASKTFYLGIPFIFGAKVLLPILHKKMTAKVMLTILGTIGLVILAILNFESILAFVGDVFGAAVARNFEVLLHVSDAFETRYTGADATLSYMPSFLQKYWLIGVGPASLEGEPIVDSAFYIIMHNGGIAGLLIVLGYYARTISRLYRKHRDLLVGMLCMVLVTGFGFQTWVASTSSLWIFLLLFLTQNERNYANA